MYLFLIVFKLEVHFVYNIKPFLQNFAVYHSSYYSTVHYYAFPHFSIIISSLFCRYVHNKRTAYLAN